MKNCAFVIAAAAAAATAFAACPNACSGNGVCSSQYDMCTCNTGYMGADCSQRICPSGLAWVDVPAGDLNNDNDLNDGGEDYTLANQAAGVTADTSLNMQVRPSGGWERHPSQLYGDASDAGSDGLEFYVRNQEGHFLSECSNAGNCNRASGLCECYPGFEGHACQFSSCPSDCSGHGVCRTIEESLPAGTMYKLWDAKKIQGCQCDGGWTGLDCSERICERGDDPLTSTTSELGINYGLRESGEVQEAEVRCSYGGKILDGMVRLQYTDAVSGASYWTPYFDVTDTGSTNEATVLGYLKALPNQVLSDYTVDGMTVESRITSVDIAAVETDQFYRITISFPESMGNVPTMAVQASDDFLCKGGAKVDTRAGVSDRIENILVVPQGDGPTTYLRYDINVTYPEDYTIDGDETMVYAVTDAEGNILGGQTAKAHDYTGTHGSVASPTMLDNVGDFSREATKLGFVFLGELDAVGNTHTFGDDTRIIIEYIVDPVVSVRNQISTIRNAAITEHINATIPQTEAGAEVAGEILQFSNASDASLLTATAPTYDAFYELEVVYVDANHEVFAWYVNDEFISYVGGPRGSINGTSSFQPEAALFANITAAQTFPAFAAEQGLVLGPGNNLATPINAAAPFPGLSTSGNDHEGEFTAGNWYRMRLLKDPVVTKSTGNDDITVRFVDNEAPTEAFTLVIKIVSTSSSVDTYAWRLAEDGTFQDNGGAGFPIPDFTANDPRNSTQLGNVANYISNQFPGDERRAQLDRVGLIWNSGVDFDSRVACNSDDPSQYYYISIGSDGLNDRPECSDRGMCDSSTGLCNCFAGYTGKACDQQSALAGAAGTISLSV